MELATDLPSRIDVALLPVPAQRLLDRKTPFPLRTMAAKGVSPGLKPHESLAVVVLLAHALVEDGAPDDVVKVSETARGTLTSLPHALLSGALTKDLAPAVLDALVPYYGRDAAVMEKVLNLPQIEASTVVFAASQASEAVAELIATNEQKLLAHPEIIEKLYMNKATRMSTADRILELAVRNGVELKGIPAFKQAAAAIVNELIAEPQEEPTYDDILFKETDELASQLEIDVTKEDTHVVDEETGQEKVAEKVLPIHARLAQMTISQKIRRATLGTSAERMMLVRDSNKLVAEAAIKSPMIQENEVVRISSSRNVTEDVLRIIAQDGEWMKSHQVKLNLVTNPRTPFVFASRLIPHLREHELKALAKSKNIPGAVVLAARQQLDKKSKKSGG